MNIHEFGDPAADVILLQMVDDHDLAVIGDQVAAMEEGTDAAFRLIAVQVDDWNADLSPWKAPAVFGKEAFGGRAAATLDQVVQYCEDRSRTYYIGGYSLAGLFALWAVYQTDVFTGAAAASPSIWFPGFTEYMKERDILCRTVYLSLGDKEEKTRNRTMAEVGDRIREAYDILKEQKARCILEWNQGNHFRNPDLRTARAFTWVLEQEKQ